ncbi:MAG TPA: response regulator [Thermodesulfobacteriota bacterium]|nr:response regulator [Thermodesulfobacteriota bacterium]
MKTILIADRDNKLRNLVRLFTESMGCRVVDASSGRDAVLKTYAVKPDIVLADVSLSDKSGYDVSREIKNNPLFGSTVVILLADSYETFDEAIAAEVHSDDFILKPFGARELRGKLEPFLTKSKGKERFKIFGLVSTGGLKSLMPVPKLTIERRVIFRSGIVALLAIFVLVLSIMYRTSDIKLSRSELSSWFNNLGNIDLPGDMPKSTLFDNILKREIISLIKEENPETSDPITEAPAILPSPLPSVNMESSFKPQTEKEGVKVYGWEEKESAEKPEGLEPKEEIPMPEKGPEEVLAGNRYVVKEGDSLWRISNSFNISVDHIRVANNLESNSLDVGDVLIMPTRDSQGEPEAENRGKVELEPVENKEIITKQDTPAAVIKEEVASESTVDIPATQPNGGYSVQVGAFQAGETAGKIADELVSKGYPAFVRTVDDPLKGRWHMIRIGKFKTMEEALDYGNQVNRKEEIVDEAIVISENTRKSKKQVSQRPKPDELPGTIQEEETEVNDLRFEEINEPDFKGTEINEPDFEQEKSRILEEIKRDKVLKDIEEKVREKDVEEEEPPVEFNARDLGVENTSTLSQVE